MATAGFSDSGTGPQTNQDGRPTNRPQTRAATLTDGVGGGGGTRGGGATTRPTSMPGRNPAPRPQRPQPSRTKPINPPLVFEPPIPPVRDPNVTDPPAKVPQPPAPSIPAPIVAITDRPDRYKITRDGWTVSAVSEGVRGGRGITPLSFRFGSRPELKPVLRADGIVVKVGKWMLVSPQTLADIQNSGNPHYDIVGNGTVLTTPIGLSVPIVELDLQKIVDLGRRRDILNTNAGVRSVEYIYESPTVMGIPEALIDQINYTLDPDTERPADTYNLWDIPMVGDYTTQPIKTYPFTAEGKLDKPKVVLVLREATTRLKGLREDLNTIKGMFYKGEISPEKRPKSHPETFRVNSADGEPVLVSTPTYVIRTTSVDSVTDTPLTTPAPPTPTAPTPATVGGRSPSDALAIWKAYGFTKTEDAAVRRSAANQTAPFVALPTGERVGIGESIVWGPEIGSKAKIILPYKLPNPVDSKTQALATEYYGGAADWQGLNRIRIAELILKAEAVNQLGNQGRA